MAKGGVKVNAVIDDTHKQSGVIAFLENTVDASTGTVTAKARIANANEGLWPGQFVKVEVVLGIEPDALSVPAAAVQLGTQGPYVFVIKDGNTAEVRPITIKRTQYGDSVIGSGLKAGESVVIDGQLRLVNGASVAVRQPEVAKPPPASNEPPKPAPPRG
jgi:multidrug efflux system membrane fusion protein